MSGNRPAWWPTAEQKRHAGAGCAHPDVCKVEPTPTVRTWADGFGRWYAEVPATTDHPERVAADAIAAELDARSERHAGWRVTVEPYDAVPSRGVLIFRERP